MVSEPGASGGGDQVVALITGAGGRVGIVGAGHRRAGPLPDVLHAVAGLESAGVRWAWWAAHSTYPLLLEAGIRPARAWDAAEVHRLLHGGWDADPARVWAGAHGLDPARMPAAPRGDLFDTESELPHARLVRPDGYLRPDAVTDGWADSDERLLGYADALLQCVQRQRGQADEAGGRLAATIRAESAAAMLCVELERDGLPVDRQCLVDLVTPLSGPREERDAAVLAQVRALMPGGDRPGSGGLPVVDLRNPASVREMLARVGIDVPSTRKHVLEAFRDVHPVVPALLTWRRQERIATTYGLRWIQERIGPDDRLRGHWTACDGAAGRMTADAGLHNLPAMLREGVAAEAGHVFVRADLGQIEPRVLAVVSGDDALAQAARADDLYAPVAQRLGVERAQAKVAVLAAMYGQRSGTAGQALRGLERAYPVAMRYLDQAYAAGVQARPVRTHGGRLIRLDASLATKPPGVDRVLDAARGRFARNAVIQGAAAELFKAWAATVRADLTRTGWPRPGTDPARIVLCLHDELLIHTPRQQAEHVAGLVDQALQAAARRWSGDAPVRFIADLSIVSRWSQAGHV
ncbi:MAG: DNA polymerase [Actinomycetales bacterium]